MTSALGFSAASYIVSLTRSSYVSDDTTAVTRLRGTMNVHEQIQEKNRHQSAARETQEQVETSIATQLEEAGFAVAAVDATSSHVEFTVTFSRMLDRNAFTDELDAVFDQFEYASVSAAEEGVQVFFTATND